MFFNFKLMALVLLLGNQCLFAQTDTTVYSIADEMPYWDVCRDVEIAAQRKKCGDDSLRLFIHKHIQYPELARANGISGTCVVEFVVMRDGSIRDLLILRSVSDACDKEVLRVLHKLINHKPFVAAKQKGKSVNCRFRLPVKFSINGGEQVLSRRRGTPPFATDSTLLQNTSLEILQRYILNPSGFNRAKFETQDSSNAEYISLDVGVYDELKVYILQTQNKGLLELEAQNSEWRLMANPKNDRILLMKRQNNSTYIAYQAIPEKNLSKSILLEFRVLTPFVLKSIIDQLP